MRFYSRLFLCFSLLFFYIVQVAAYGEGSCQLDGNSVADGRSIVAYQQDVVGVNYTCEEETRTCENGNLTGSFEHTTCYSEVSITDTQLSDTFTITVFEDKSDVEMVTLEELVEFLETDINELAAVSLEEATFIVHILTSVTDVYRNFIIELPEKQYTLENTIELKRKHFSRDGETNITFRGREDGTVLTFAETISDADLIPVAGEENLYEIKVDADPAGVMVNDISTREAIQTIPESLLVSDFTESDFEQYPDIDRDYLPDFILPGTIGLPGLRNLTAVATNSWRMYRCPISESKRTGRITQVWIDSDCKSSADKNNTNLKYGFNTIDFIVGHHNFLDSHGDWVYMPHTKKVRIYLDRSSRIKLMVNEKDHFFDIDGVSSTYVNGITFENINFVGGGDSDADWYSSQLAGFHLLEDTPVGGTTAQSGTIKLKDTKNIVIRNSVFRSLLGSGIEIDVGVDNVTIIDSIFSDINGSAISMGRTTAPSNAKRHISNIAILKNDIKRIGKIYWDSPAIMGSYIRDSRIAFNSISTIPYSGIRIGWNWQYTPQPSLTNNLIHNNAIDHLMLRMNDGGGITLMSAQRGTKVYENIVSNISYGHLLQRGRTDVPNFPYYLDAGSRFIEVTNNYVRDVDFDNIRSLDENQVVFGQDSRTTNAIIQRMITDDPEYYENNFCGKKACDVIVENNLFLD